MSDRSTCEIRSFENIYSDIAEQLYKLIQPTSFVLRHQTTRKFYDRTDVELRLEIPFEQKFNFVHNDNEFFVIRHRYEDQIVGTAECSSIYEKIIIESDNEENLRKLLTYMINKIQVDKLKEREYVDIWIYEEGQFWKLLNNQPKRSFDTIIIDDEIKKSLITDIQRFINDKKLFYEMNIPYKRNYLFYGVPGTGKTSIAHAIASHFNLDIYVAKLSSLKRTLEHCVNGVKDGNILLLEDIEHTIINNKDFKLSDLLNVLDGVNRKNLIIIMTANCIDQIPSKILRPGRVDMKIKFSYCRKAEIIKIFNRFCPTEDAEAFYQSIKSIDSLTPAILQEFLFRKPLADKTVGALKELVNFSKEKMPSYYG